MIGGIVTEVIKLPDKIWVNCEEAKSTSRCAIYVRRSTQSEQIKPADSVWWQGQWAMWTPYKGKPCPPGRCGLDYDIKIERLGFSGVKRPVIA